MVWTVYFLVGMTVAAASTANRPYEHVNSRPAARNAISYTDNAVEDVNRHQLPKEEPTQWSANGFKVLSRKPYLESRRGQAKNKINQDKIVFPGPTAESRYRIKMPEHCKKLGICEDAINYPQELADKIIAELGDTSMFQNDIMNSPDITQRLGPEEENIELCNMTIHYLVPRAGYDSTGKLHTILNQDPPVQSYRAEICGKDGDACSKIAIFLPQYTARCVQKYTFRRMVVIYNGKELMKEIKMPSCCSCVASTTRH